MHTALPVEDIGRARAFYADKLGLQPQEENPEAPQFMYRRGGMV